jgi:hypothetical protein
LSRIGYDTDPERGCTLEHVIYNEVVSLVWMIPALGVSVLTVVVVLQLLDVDAGRSAGRLIASAVGVLMLLEGALVWLTSPGFSDDAGITTATHGVALMVAGAGIWGIAHRALWSRVASHRRRA